MLLKGFVTHLFLILARALCAIGRAVFLPILVRIYRLLSRARRLFAPAERQLALVITHRGLLHAAVIGIALTTAGGNLYAQTQNTVASGDSSILYRFFTNQEQLIEESGLPSVNAARYLADSLDADQNSEADSEAMGTFSEADLEESDALTELGALLPQPAATGAGVVHRTTAEIYEVQAGDTLSGIANRFNVSIATILWENKLTARDFIKPGQKLTILPSSGVSHTVKSGDTVQKIAKAYNAEAADILSWNNLSEGASLQIGQQLFVPNGRITTVAAAPKPKVTPLASPREIFTVPPAAVDDGSTDLLWPAISHRITQYYGNWRRGVGRHTGIDFGDKTGNPIYAADDGIITHAGCGTSCRKGYGYYVDIDHGNGISTRYGHASKILVSVGDQVHRGDVIALIGSTGMSTGPHLHFEVFVSGKRVNPLPYIR